MSSLLWQYLVGGDLIGFITACYTSAIGQGYYALGLFLVFGVIYLRTRSLALCSILWLLLGTAWIATTFIVSPIAILLTAFGLLGILYSVFGNR